MRVRWTASGPTIYAYVGNDPLGSIDPQGLNADDLSETPGQRSLEQLHSQEHDVISPLVDTDLNNDGIQDVISPVVMNVGAGRINSSCSSSSIDYRGVFFNKYPELKGKVVVHHAVEQQVLKRYPQVMTADEIHSLSNLRGIPNDLNSELHLSLIRREWNRFYRKSQSVTKEQLQGKASEIDSIYGQFFNPPVEEK